MTVLKTSIALLSITLLSCASTKSQGNTTSSNETKTISTDSMLSQGYKKATVVASAKEGDCPFTFRIEDAEPYYLDPINLEDEYKKDAMKVWLTFAGLRMMNRCEKANPISIIDIQKRNE